MSRNRSQKRRNVAGIKNNLTFQHYLKLLTELAVNRFEWQNMPPEIDTRYIEMQLIKRPGIVFFQDKNLAYQDAQGYLFLPFNTYDRLSVYNNPVKYNAVGANGYFSSELSPLNSVICWANKTRSADMPDLIEYAQKLAEIDRTILTNCNAQKTPIIVKGSQNQRLTLENFLADVENNVPYAFIDADSFNGAEFNVFNTSSPFVGDKLQELKEAYWNEALTFLGISNVRHEKKERLITDEVQRALGGTYAARFTGLDMRRNACEQINKMFGLDIWVDWRAETEESDSEIDEPDDAENDEDNDENEGGVMNG